MGADPEGTKRKEKKGKERVRVAFVLVLEGKALSIHINILLMVLKEGQKPIAFSKESTSALFKGGQTCYCDHSKRQFRVRVRVRIRGRGTDPIRVQREGSC